MSASLSWNETSTADTLTETLRNKFETDTQTPKLIAELVLNILQSEKEWEGRKYVFRFAIPGIGRSHFYPSYKLRLYIAESERRAATLGMDIKIVSNTE